MKRAKGAEAVVRRRRTAAVAPRQAKSLALPLKDSLGYQVRVTHRSIQRLLEATIAPYGVKLGMWYFLRVLWEEDGQTQSELSKRIGTMEPTTLHAIAGMEECGLVTRKRNADDRRKMHVFLTKKGRQLESKLLPLAVQVLDAASAGLSASQVRQLLSYLRTMQVNLAAALATIPETDAER